MTKKNRLPTLTRESERKYKNRSNLIVATITAMTSSTLNSISNSNSLSSSVVAVTGATALAAMGQTAINSCFENVAIDPCKETGIAFGVGISSASISNKLVNSYNSKEGMALSSTDVLSSVKDGVKAASIATPVIKTIEEYFNDQKQPNYLSRLIDSD